MLNHWLAKSGWVTLLIVLVGWCSAEDENGWRYVADDDFGQAPLRYIQLEDEPPGDVEVAAVFRGSKQRFAQLRYGIPNSTRVAVVVDEIRRGESDFYVDANRDRIIDRKDLLPGSGRSRQCELAAEVSVGLEADYYDRVVRLRLGITGKKLGVATVGYVEGSVLVDERTVQVRRVDGDANGFFADARDRLWLDLDNDGDWDSFTEQYPFQPILRIADQRLAVRGDALGASLKMDTVSGTGKVQLHLKSLQPGARVVAVDAMLTGNDGSAFSIRSGGSLITVPVGRYAVDTVYIALALPDDDRTWSFVFSRMSSSRLAKQFTVAQNQTTAIDPIGTLKFLLESGEGLSSASAGQRLYVEPRLYTATGLLINSGGCRTAASADSSESNPARLTLQTLNQDVLSTAQSGFA